MRNGFKRLLLPILFVALVSGGIMLRPAPAQAGCCNLSAVVKAVNDANTSITTAVNNAKTAIVYSLVNGPDNFSQMFEFVDNTNKTQPSNNVLRTGRVTSIVDYFESVYWPRFLLMNKILQSGEAENLANNMASSIQIADAGMQIDHGQKIREFNANTAADSVGRDDVVCEHATQWSPLVAGKIISDINTREDLRQDLARLGGSSAYPENANGVVNDSQKRLAERVNMGLCDPTGNNGANAAWCKEAENPALINADKNPQSLLEAPIITQTEGVPNNSEIVDKYAENATGRTTFTPIRADQLQGERMSNAAREILTERDSYDAKVATLRMPFRNAKNDRLPIEGSNAEIVASYQAILNDLSITGDLTGRYIDNGNMSRQSMEEMVYRTNNQNPKGLSNLAGSSVLNIGNTLVFMAIKAMESVVMLYDIREEQRKTNILLGTIGGFMAEEAHARIEAKTRSLATTNN